MEQQQQNPEEQIPEEQLSEKPYVPRPKWQVVLAWVGLGLMVGLLIMQLLLMLQGGAV